VACRFEVELRITHASGYRFAYPSSACAAAEQTIAADDEQSSDIAPLRKQRCAILRK